MTKNLIIFHGAAKSTEPRDVQTSLFEKNLHLSLLIYAKAGA